MGKQITIGIASTIAAAILIAFFVSWLNAQKNEVIVSVSKKIDESSESIRSELKEERKNRSELAVALLKYGVDIPTDIIVGFSSIKSDPSIERYFINALADKIKPLNYERYSEFYKQLKNRKYPVALYANMNDRSAMLAFTDETPESSKIIATKRLSIKFKNEDGEEIPVMLDVNVLKDPIELLSEEGLRASNVIAVPR